MRKPDFNAAVYGIFKNNSGELLFQKRKNTGFADGYFQIPSGHVEHQPVETIETSLIREMREELGVDIKEGDIEEPYIQFTCGKVTKSYFNFFFVVNSYTGVIENKEPEKCEELIWIHPRDFSKYKIVYYSILALQDIDNGLKFTSNIFDKKEQFLG